MKPCKTPTKLKKGSVLYSFIGISYDNNTSTVEAHEWHVRSIQTKPTYLSVCNTKCLGHTRLATFVNLVSKKKGVTWVKNDWAKYTPKDYQNKFELKNVLPKGIYTTQLQAIKFAVKNQHTHIDFAKSKLLKSKTSKDINIWTIELADYERELKRLTARLVKIKKEYNS